MLYFLELQFVAACQRNIEENLWKIVNAQGISAIKFFYYLFSRTQSISEQIRDHQFGARNGCMQ